MKSGKTFAYDIQNRDWPGSQGIIRPVNRILIGESGINRGREHSSTKGRKRLERGSAKDTREKQGSFRRKFLQKAQEELGQQLFRPDGDRDRDRRRRGQARNRIRCDREAYGDLQLLLRGEQEGHGGNPAIAEHVEETPEGGFQGWREGIRNGSTPSGQEQRHLLRQKIISI